MKPLAEILWDIAVSRPGTELYKTRLGIYEPGWHAEGPAIPVLELLDLTRRAIEDPRLYPTAKARVPRASLDWEELWIEERTSRRSASRPRHPDEFRRRFRRNPWNLRFQYGLGSPADWPWWVP